MNLSDSINAEYIENLIPKSLEPYKRNQFLHAQRIAHLLRYVLRFGLYPRIDCSGCRPCEKCGNYHHRKNSLHADRMATDIDFYDSSGRLVTDANLLQEAGMFWEKIGGSWGGRFGDPRHFSSSFGGRK